MVDLISCWIGFLYIYNISFECFNLVSSAIYSFPIRAFFKVVFGYGLPVGIFGIGVGLQHKSLLNKNDCY